MLPLGDDPRPKGLVIWALPKLVVGAAFEDAHTQAVSSFAGDANALPVWFTVLVARFLTIQDLWRLKINKGGRILFEVAVEYSGEAYT
jgi:hypothetical protein